MPKQKVTEVEIIKHSFRLFREKSYHNTSMADIAQECGILKGSLYHYFPSKEALMSAVIIYAHAYFKEKVFSIAYDEALTPQERIEKMFQKSEKTLLSDGNIMGNIGVETARIIPEFANHIRDFYEEWINAVAHIFSNITNENDAQNLAEQTVAEFEGAVMMSRIFKDTKFMKNAYIRLKSRFAAITLSDLKH
ncbi:MAG: TetR/AcrR family transcriptional regulator [Sphingobacteriales bacterium]|nr:MAG: TetR/AcrR family transcriptional regulator [Sphingobacteriales bacterium]